MSKDFALCFASKHASSISQTIYRAMNPTYLVKYEWLMSPRFCLIHHFLNDMRVQESFPLHLLDWLSDHQWIVEPTKEILKQKDILLKVLRNLLIGAQFPESKIIKALKKLLNEIVRYVKELDIQEVSWLKPSIDSLMYPAIYFTLVMMKLLGFDVPAYVVAAEENYYSRHIFSPKLSQFNYLAKLNSNIIWQINFIHSLIIIYFRLTLHIIIFKLMTDNKSNKSKGKGKDIMDVEEPKTTGTQEYSKGANYRNNQVKGEDAVTVLKKKWNFSLAVKARSYCRYCCDLDHVDPTFCIRKCTICRGDHWRRQCTAFNKCRWCGSARGSHECTKLDLSSILTRCPICRLTGHYATQCKPLFRAISSCFGPLKRRFRKATMKIRKLAKRIQNRRDRRIRRK